MLDVINGISTNMSKNQYTGLIYLDLKKRLTPYYSTCCNKNLNIMAYMETRSTYSSYFLFDWT